MAMGQAHSIAIRTDGTVLTWGDNDRGQLGRGTVDAVNVRREPEVLPGIANAVAAAAGENFSLLLLADGSVLSWGDNTEGQLGHGPAGVFPRPGQAMPPVPAPSPVAGLSHVTQVAAGARFALALGEDGRVVAWGDGNLGALGDGKGAGSGSHYAVPFPRPVIGLSNIAAIAAGTTFGLAMGRNGTVWGWGANEYGQMGDDAVDFKATPVRLAGVTGARSVYGVGRTGVALLNDGSVVAWGKNDYNLLGVPEGKLPKSATPVRIAGLIGVKQIATSSMAVHVLAMMADGTVHGWGGNNFSQLSNGPWANGRVTVPLTGVAAVAAGGPHTNYLMPDGRVLVTGFRMADLVDRVPREVARLDPASIIRCTVPASGPAGTWAFSSDAVQQGQGITRADQTAALTKATAFRSLLMEPYADTLRIESEGQRFVRKAEPPVDGPLVFGFEALYLMSICDTTSGDVHEIGSTRSQATLVANDLGDFLSSFGEPVEIAGAPVQLFQLAPRDGTVGGLPAFQARSGRAVLVTREGQSPYTVVTRGEFLDALERHWQSQGASTSAQLQDVIREFEAQIKQTRAELTGELRDTIVAEMERNLKEIKAQLPANQAKASAAVNEEVTYIRQYRQKASAADMAHPAVLASFGFRGEFSDGDTRAGRAIVRLNPQYFAKERPHDVQVLALQWEWSEGHPQDEAWRMRFEATFPFARLQALLDPQ